MEPLIYIIIVLAIVIALSGLKITEESERIAITSLGKFVKLSGPGLLYRLPGSPQKWTRIKLGDSGKYLGDGLAEINGATCPVEAPDSPVNASVKISSFKESRVWVSQAN